MIANSVSCYHSKHNFKYKNIAGITRNFSFTLDALREIFL